MKKISFPLLILLILFIFALIMGCNSNIIRIDNPNIKMTAEIQPNGSYTKNLIDVENKYLVTLKISNSGNDMAKNVKIDRYSYCDDSFSYLRYCKNGSFNDIGNLQINEEKIKYINFERSAILTPINVKYHLIYNASSEYIVNFS